MHVCSLRPSVCPHMPPVPQSLRAGLDSPAQRYSSGLSSSCTASAWTLSARTGDARGVTSHIFSKSWFMRLSEPIGTSSGVVLREVRNLVDTSTRASLPVSTTSHVSRSPDRLLQPVCTTSGSAATSCAPDPNLRVGTPAAARLASSDGGDQPRPNLTIRRSDSG